jgi:hypothetical protein
MFLTLSLTGLTLRMQMSRRKYSPMMASMPRRMVKTTRGTIVLDCVLNQLGTSQFYNKSCLVQRAEVEMIRRAEVEMVRRVDDTKHTFRVKIFHNL